MRVLLDLDGVLCDFVGGAMRLHGLPNPYLDPALAGIWDFVAQTGIEPAKFWTDMGRDFWAGLDWLPDGPAIYRTLVSRFGESNLWICSSPCDTAGCLDGKRDWIKEHLPALGKRFVFTQGKEVLAGPETLLIDDNDVNCQKFQEAGGQAYLVPRVWNSLHGFRNLWEPGDLPGRPQFAIANSPSDTQVGENMESG